MCDNKIDVTVSSDGWNYIVREYPCSSTGPQGELILCPKCEPQRTNREENAYADNAWLQSAGWGEI